MPAASSRRRRTAEIFARPLHPYTRHLVGSLPRIGDASERKGLDGSPPNLADPPPGCRFHPRCPLAMDVCRREQPAMIADATGSPGRLLRGAPALGGAPVTGALIELANVRKSFTRGGLLSHRRVQAVDDVSFRIAADDPVIFTIIGESGSGKSTLARMILNITPPTSGSIVFRGRDLSTIRSGADRTAFMAAVQPIFQNPFEAFNPLKRLDHYLHVTARRFTGAKGEAVEQRTDEVLRQVGLSLAEVRGRFPHELSGGQLQRVAIARALVSRPAPHRRRRAGLDGRCVAAHVHRQPVPGAARRSRHLDRLHHA